MQQNNANPELQTPPRLLAIPFVPLPSLFHKSCGSSVRENVIR